MGRALILVIFCQLKRFSGATLVCLFVFCCCFCKHHALERLIPLSVSFYSRYALSVFDERKS